MALTAAHTYRINYDAWIGQRKYSPVTFVTQKQPPTRWRAHEAARDSFAPYIDSRRMLRRLRVTAITKV
jgi:hypothetical protein